MTKKHGKAKHNEARTHRGEHERETQAAEAHKEVEAEAPPAGQAKRERRPHDRDEGIEVAMLTVVEKGGAPRSMPMYTQPKAKFDGTLWFMTSRSSRKVHEIEDDQHVGLCYVDQKGHRYVSVTGRASVLRDQAKIDELWTPLHLAFWPAGREDPDIVLLKVEVDRAEYWDTPEGRLAQVLGFAKAILTGQPYQPGTNEELKLH
jgi:general stress protein 26